MNNPDDIPSWIQFFTGLGIIAAIAIVATIVTAIGAAIGNFVTNWKAFKEWKRRMEKGEV